MRLFLISFLVGIAPLPAISSSLDRLAKLTTKDVNFVHTSDIHSWYLGHQKKDPVSKSWSANIGDVISFVEHMKQSAHDLGQDLFFVDTGDQTHGGGLSDADEPIAGAKTLDIQMQIAYDIMIPGNHELEDPKIAKNLYNAIKKLGSNSDKYLASNVYIDVDGQRLPLAKQYRTWHATWKNATGGDVLGRKVTALGLTSKAKDKAGKAPGPIYLESISEMIQQSWFKDIVLNSDPDMFLLAGHLSLHESDHPQQWREIHKAIRDKYPLTPIFIFAGHSHFRNCFLMDSDMKLPGSNKPRPDRSIAIESGRYLETVGWVSANFPKPNTGPLEFNRRWLDANPETFKYHTGKDDTNFSTEDGKKILQEFKDLAAKMNLTELYGCAPRTYGYDHVPYTANAENHALVLYMNGVVPEVIIKRTDGQLDPYVLVLNSGIMRGPIFQGRYTKDDNFMNIPRPDNFRYLRVARLVAEKIVDELDRAKKPVPSSSNPSTSSANSRPYSIGRYTNQIALQDIVTQRFASVSGYAAADVPGYATRNDSCLFKQPKLGRGDDVLHSPALDLQYPPNYIRTMHKSLGNLDLHDFVDVVTTRYLEGKVLDAVNNIIGLHNQYNERGETMETVKNTDIHEYSKIDTGEALRIFAKNKWNKDC
ncbi:hypothetical protein FRB95_004438 [Tulasnella sp. JGI-2019a]|nr:hypothetical protein FRB95_004438 [Tulasnella sp. JGI-2019a]